ncbi:Transcriptional antiterminator [Propionispira arboris]|uniref:Transcriptional antiterminator n=1 Tax=Propionispira arboris TaxID=84035 RepID=A0A1H6VDF9_9FIRM|nr:Transcriptional antiterminator [Propionispira arboris]
MKVLETAFYDTPLTVEKIAGLLNTSPRTVRYDLDSLEGEFKKRKWKLYRKAHRGVWIELAAESEKIVGELTNDAYIYSKEERYNSIIVNLLDGEDSISIDSLANKLKVSRNTLLMDLREVRRILQNRKIEYYSKRGLGIWAEGDEQSVRDMLIHIFAKRLHDFKNFPVREDTDEISALFKEYSINLPVKDIAEFFLALMRKNKIMDNDTSMNRMICALLVQFKRLQQACGIEDRGKVEFVSDEGMALRQLSQEIASHMKSYHMGFQDSKEISFIMRELLHSKIYLFPTNKKQKIWKKDANIASMDLAKNFIEYVQMWLGDIYMDDDELIYGLALHLQPAVERARAGIELTNPLLSQIRRQYSDLFDIALKAAEKLSRKMNIKLSDDEIGYLTIHLGAAIERRKIRHVKKLEVLLVCGNGIGTANLLAMTLGNNMSYIHIKKIISLYELESWDLFDIDIVISTISLNLKDKAVLRVSPILTDVEIPIIENQIQYFYNKKFAPEKLESPVQIQRPGLAAVLNLDVIQLDAVAVDWEDAIRQSGRLLAANGAIEERYIDCMIRCVREIGPYTVVGPGIAMPHSRCEDGVKKVGVSFLRLVSPVCFGNTVNDPVDLIFAFSTVDEKAHLKIMEDLWEIFTDKNALEYLRKCKTKEAVISFIQQR